MKEIKNFNNSLLHRKEVKVIIQSSGNPGFQKSIKLLAEHFKSNEENVAVKEIKSKFGRDSFLIEAFIYDSVQEKNLIEPKKKEKKDGGAK